MALRVVGAGVGRTGTHSLKVALEQLLGGPCYHMIEVLGHPEHMPLWRAAADDPSTANWDALFDGYVAAVDWPAASFWRELSERYPDALVILSVRESPEAWWKSASNTIFEALAIEGAPSDFPDMVGAVLEQRFDANWRDPTAAKAAYERHNAAVRAGVAGPRLLEWTAGDGWGPICSALGVPEPPVPFPHVNTTAEFRTMTGLNAP